MTKLRLGLLVASAVLAAILVILLGFCTGLDFAALGRELRGVRPQEFAEIVLLTAVNSFLAGEKWRLIAARLDSGAVPPMPRVLYFAFTSIGVGLGQVMPLPLSLVASRSLGAQLHGGRGLVRGGGATVFDYGFDLLVAAGFTLATLLALMVGGGGRGWMICALAIGTAGFLAYGLVARYLARIAARLAAALTLPCRASGRSLNRVRRFAAVLAASPLLAPEIGRRLLMLSLLRFGVLVLISAVGARAIGLDVALWQLAAALPFASFANLLALTPGGIGFNEWALSAALAALGASFQIAAQLALGTRALASLAAVLVGLAGAAVAAAARLARPSRAA